MGRFAPKITKFLKAQGKVITADIERLLKKKGFGKADAPDFKTVVNEILSSIYSASWDADLKALMYEILLKIYTDGMKDTYSQISDGHELDQAFHDYANKYANDRTAELVTKLDDSTRDMLRSDLMGYMDQSLTPMEIAANLEDNYAFSSSRSKMIARTETGFAWNDAGLSTYSVAEEECVTVYDGDYDAECQEADKQIWTIEYSREHLLQHPRCVRSFGPAPKGAIPDRGELKNVPQTDTKQTE